MHSSNLNLEVTIPNEVEVLSSVSTLVTEGRIPGAPDGDVSKSKAFHEGPHCPFPKKGTPTHQCNRKNQLCSTYKHSKENVVKLSKSSRTSLCVEVFLICGCNLQETTKETEYLGNGLLLEQWHFVLSPKRDTTSIGCFNLHQLVSAIRSQLYFSQLTAWLVTQAESHVQITSDHLRYQLTTSDCLQATPKFSKHDFPTTDLGTGTYLNVSYYSAPRTASVPSLTCEICESSPEMVFKSDLLDDRFSCNLKGKHRCDDVEEDGEVSRKVPGSCANKRICQLHRVGDDENDKASNPNWRDKGQILLDAIERSGRRVQDGERCDTNHSDIFRVRETTSTFIVPVQRCDSPVMKKTGARKRIDFEDCAGSKTGGSYACDIPSASEQAKFRRNLGNAASMVFHSRTGLPLTSSPAPVRKGRTRFDFDSTLNSVSAIKSALFSNSFSTDDESESEGSIVSPCSPEIYASNKRDLCPVVYKRKGQSAGLLGSFEESVLNGRLEPVSTVHGFTAELGASGSFVPKHVFLPVTVFFYSFGDNDQVSSPYLGHINLGKKGYNVPKSGTVQVTLFNPLGTVVKMFVVMYDLSDMPANSQTFIRQRTLYMPTSSKGDRSEWGPKWLRYVIHLRFMSSKSNKVYLHSDIRMIVSKKSDMDTATAHGMDMSYELRSFIHMPTNPRFSSRK